MVVPANDLAFIDMLWRDWSPGYDGAIDSEISSRKRHKLST